MRTIDVFYDNSSYTLRWLRALVFARKEFLEEGVDIHFDSIYAPLPNYQTHCPPPMSKEGYFKLFSKPKYDIVFLAYHHSQAYGLCNLSCQERSEVLLYIKEKTRILCWLDTSDSTGTCMFDVLPYVDYYFKKQLLKDMSLYYEPHYGGRIWCEYYHIHEQINDPKLSTLKYDVLEKQYESKIRLSWNVGLGDLFTKTGFQKLVFRRRYAPFDFTEPSMNRKYDYHFRGTTSNSLALYQRNMTIKILKDMKNGIIPDSSKKVPYKDYVSEVKNSRSLISPFGWGEICGRDFEAFMYGAALIKMEMSHLVTFPNVYQDNITYFPIRWDFSNFAAVLDYILTEKGKIEALELARNGQSLYKEYLTSKKRKKEFVNHLMSQLVG